LIKGGVLGPLPFDPETLTKYASVRTWLSSVSSEHTGSKRTRELYLWYFTRWVEWTGKNPDALKGHEGHHVAVTGHVMGDSVHVESVKML